MSKGDQQQSLNWQERIFVAEYLIDLDAQRAALKAGYSPSVAKSKAYLWVSDGKLKPHVYAEVTRQMDKRAKKAGVTADRVIEELAKIAFGSMRNFISIDGDGQPQINLTDTDDDNLDALAEVQTETVLESRGRGEDKETDVIRKTKIKLHDKLGALKELAEYAGVYRESDKNKADLLVQAFNDVFARGSKAPIRRDADE